jgi:SurA N-terminal domain
MTAHHEDTKKHEEHESSFVQERRRLFVFPRVFVMICGIAMSLPTAAGAEILDRVLAVVGGDVITLTDVTAARELGLQSADNASDPVRAVLSKLIDRELVLAEVERYAPPEPSAEAVDAELAAVRARFRSADAFNDTLTRSGIDEKHLRETLRQDLRIRAYEDQRFAAAGDRRPELIDEWIAALRRRGDVVDLYLPTTRN